MTTDADKDTKKSGLRAEALDSIHKELMSRSGRREDIVLRMKLWRITVRMSYFLKRFIDIAVSFCALVCLAPFFLILGLLIKATSSGPIIFTQTRVGRFGRHFKFYKFRTMYTGAERAKQELLSQNQSADGVIFKMKNDPRITRLGRILRKTSIDELPQLFNVLLGDMSLVGARPPLPSEVREYSLEDRKRLNVKPGLTCIWQISGRSNLPFSKQVQLDKEYISSRGFWTDIKILLKTIPAIIMGKGAY